MKCMRQHVTGFSATSMCPGRRHGLWLAIAVLLALSAPISMPSRVCSAVTRSGALPFEAELAPSTFLVASRRLRDPNFASTVILLVTYDESGAKGLIINHPSPFQLSNVLPDLPPSKAPSPPVYLGGPVGQTQLRLLVQTDKPSEAMQQVLDDVYLSGSADDLQQILTQPAARFRIFAGYASWAPGQLESEIAQGAWHIFHADVDTIFEASPDSLWPKLIRQRDLQRM